MTFSITRTQRSLLLAISAIGYVTWLAGIGAPSGAQSPAGEHVPNLTIAAEPPLPRVADAIKRDPFAGAPPDPPGGAGASSRDDASSSEAAMASSAGEAADERVPDIATGNVPPAIAQTPAMTLTLRATIVGKTSVAYVANGSEMDIVRVGDSLGDRRVTKIDIDGIAFDDGTRLNLASGYDATPAPVAPRDRSVTIPLAQLRKLLQPAQATPTVIPTPEPSQQALVTAPPAVVATPSQALPTANTSGLQPGQNATSQPGAATAYPYPYPYPPTHR